MRGLKPFIPALLAVAVGSCASPQQSESLGHFVRSATKLKICDEAQIAIGTLPKKPPDLSVIDVRVPERCALNFQDSAIIASGGGCRSLLSSKLGCAYFNGRKAISLGKVSNGSFQILINN